MRVRAADTQGPPEGARRNAPLRPRTALAILRRMADPASTDRGLTRGLTILGGAVVIAAALIAWGLTQVRPSDDDLSVTGSARRAVASDLVVWRLSVTSQGGQLTDALRDVNAQAERVRAFLRAQHVPDSTVAVSPLSTGSVPEVRNGNETGRVAAYRLTQGFTVTSRDVAATSAVVARIADLITQGVPVHSEAPEYLVSKLPELRVALLTDAVKDARVRADQIAAAAGTAVGRVKAVRVGVFQVTQPNSTSVSDYGNYDTSSRDKDVTVTVHVTYAFK